MSKASIRARAVRDWLFDQLGRHCALCGSVIELQMDFIKSDGGRHHGMSFVDRQRAYLTEFNRGNLRVLCGPCNRSEGMKLRQHRATVARFCDSVSEFRLRQSAPPSQT